MFVAALGKFKLVEPRELLTELLSDPDAKDKAESALKKNLENCVFYYAHYKYDDGQVYNCISDVQ